MKLSVGPPPSLVKGFFAEPNLKIHPEGVPLVFLPTFGPRIQMVPERMGPGAWGPSLRLRGCECVTQRGTVLCTPHPFHCLMIPSQSWCGGCARRRAGPRKRPTAVSLLELWKPHQGSDGAPGGGCLSVENLERTVRPPQRHRGVSILTRHRPEPCQ